MLDIGLSVVCSVLVASLLKLAPRWRIDLLPAIACNYIAAAALCHFLLPAPPAIAHSAPCSWQPLLGLGLLLPTIFLIQGLAIRRAGIVQCEVAQRLSLLLSLLAAFVWFGEPLTIQMVMGLGLGFIAIGCLLSGRGGGQGRGGARWLALVFVGYAAINILFKQVARAGSSFVGSLETSFILAAVLCALALGWQAWRGRGLPGPRQALAGLALGVINFANILFYMRAHLALPSQPAVVFAAMNLGVVSLGALTGTALFGERLSPRHGVGLALALAAIAIIAGG